MVILYHSINNYANKIDLTPNLFASLYIEPLHGFVP
jgi:hypothetical protein